MSPAGLKNILTIDVEDWFHMNYDSMSDYADASFEPRVEQNTERILQILSDTNSRSTMFFLGSVAENHPDLVRRAHDAGHEIASHGYGHELVYELDRDRFRADVERSVGILQDITGEPLAGYRAPSWSISDRTPWFYDVLEELGFRYSSSMFPFKTYLYGDSTAPTDWYETKANGSRFVELPSTVVEWVGRRVPFAGGFYMRALPYWAIRWATRRVTREGRPAIYYLHPREIDPEHPRLELPLVDRLVSYWGLRGTERKLRKLLERTRTMSCLEYLEECGALGSNQSTEPTATPRTA